MANIRTGVILALACTAAQLFGQTPAEYPSGALQSQGLLYKFYTNTSTDGTLPTPTPTAMEALTATSSGVVSNFLLDPRGSVTTNFSFEYTGYVNIPTAGVWTFATNSDDGTVLYISGIQVVANNYSQGATRRSGTIDIGAGLHAIKVQYGQGGGAYSLAVTYIGPAGSSVPSEVAIPNTALYYIPPTATPTISPANNKIGTPTFQMSLADTTPGAAMYYTTNGTTPTTASTLYTGPVTLSIPVTVNAIAKAANYDNSFVATTSFVTSAAPANDNFANAVNLGSSMPLTVNGTNLNATWEAGEPNHGNGDGQSSIWYKWIAPSTGSVYISTAGSAFDTTLAVYTGTAVNALTLVGQNDDAIGDNPNPGTGSTSLVAIQAAAGTTYYIAIDGLQGAQGNTTLSISAGAVLSVVATTPNASETGPVSGVFTITRTGNTSAAFYCNFSLDGTAIKSIDYLRPVDDFIAFSAGQTSATVTITPVDNFMYQGPVTVVLSFLPSDYFEVNPAQATATVTIADNETATSGTVKDTSFSVKRGFYTAPIDVAITTATAGASIRYTLDGTMPTPVYGIVYTGPIHITGTTTLRAMAYKAGMNPTNVDTQTYLYTADIITQCPTGAAPNANWPAAGTIPPVGQTINYGMDPNIVNNAEWSGTIQNDLKTIPSFCVSMKLGDLFDSTTGIYANPSGDSFVWERPCALELVDPNNSANNWGELCGIRIRGGYSRNPGNPKHAFRIFFRSDYNKGTLQQPIFGPPPAQQKIDAFDIRCDQNYSWSFEGNRAQECFMRDNFSRDSQLAISGFGCRGDYYHLYIDGIYWGLYNSDERGEQGWAANYFGGNKADYDIIKSQTDTGYTIFASNGDMNAWNRLWKACKDGLSTNAAYYKIQGKNPDGTPNPTYENLLEIDDLIDYMLVIYYGGNLDSPISQFLNNQEPNNFFGQRNRNGNAGFRFTIHDAEHTLLDVNANRLGPWPAGDTVQYSNPQWMFQQCEVNAEFRMRVADHMRKHFFNGGAFTPAPCIARFNARKAQLDRAVVGESARWGDSKTTPACTRDDWVAACNTVLNNFFPGRTQVVINQFIAAGLYPSLSAPNYSQYGGNITSGFVCTISNPNATGTIYYTTDGSDPRKVGGSINSTAVAGGTVSKNVTMNGTVTLRARIYDGTNWSALQDNTFTAPQDFSTLKVTEIMYNPPDFDGVDGQQFEFIELKNTGSVALNLSGAQFTSGIVYTFPSGAVINPGQFIVLASNPQQFAIKYPGITPYAAYSGQLSNSGGTITLQYSTGATIFSFSYNDAAPWPVVADGLGFSLVPKEGAVSAGYGDYNYWRASTNMGGSPGADDPASTFGKVLINEALTHVTPPAQEYIELYNAGTTTVDISGWYLTDDRHTPQKFKIPSGTILNANSYIYFTDAQYNPTPGVGTSFALDSHGEEVFVFSADSTGALTGYSHGFTFGAAQNPVAFGRYTISTGADQFVRQASNTPGQVNSGPAVGPLVFSEVMYQPAAGGDQFIEILNITNSPVPLYDPANPANTWLIDGIGFTFPQNITVAANGLFLVTGIDPTVFRAKYSVPAGIPIYGPWTGTLSTSGEHIELQKPDNPDPVQGGGVYVPYVAVEALDYANTAPWPLEAAGTGPSLVRINPLTYSNDPINWKKSSTNGGSPGTSDQLIPSAPANLAAAVQSYKTINLTWTATSGNETSFTLQRSLDGTNWSSLNPLGANVTFFQDTGLTASTQFYYRVYASNSFGDSGFSNVVTASTPAPPPPNAPTVLVAITMTQSKLRLEWSDGSDNEDGFKVERSQDGINNWTEIGSTPTDTTVYYEQNLAPNTIYYYRVRAFNAYGYSAYTNVAQGSTEAPRFVKGHTNGNFIRGHKASVFVDLDSPGNEQTIAFSLNYNTVLLANPVVLPAAGIGSNVTITPNLAGAAVGVTVGFNDGSTFPVGVKGLVEIRFDALITGTASSSTAIFGDTPTARAILDASGQPMEGSTVDIPLTFVPNSTPVAGNGALTVTEDLPQNGTLSATDADNDALTYSVVSQPAKGSVTITNAATGAYTYTPALYVNGSDSFTFKANDGNIDSAPATISVTITPVNHAPTAQNGTLNVNEDSFAQGTLQAADVDNDALLYSVVTQPSYGAVTIVDSATGAYKYTPNALYFGSDTFSFKVNDGTVDSNTASVSVTVAHVNHAPTAQDGTLNVNEDSFATGALLASDLDNDALTFSIVSQPANGGVTITNTATGAFTFTPNSLYYGSDSFTFKVNDGTVDSNTATLSVTVAHVNHAPVAQAGTINVNENESVQSTLSATDLDNDTLTFSIVTQPSSGTLTLLNAATGAYSYVPVLHFSGSDSFTFKVNDGTADSNAAAISISVAAFNHAPAAPNQTITTLDSQSVTGTVAAADIDGDTLTYRIVTNGSKGSAVIDPATGAFTYTPSGGTGTDSFTVVANDGTADSAPVTITVTLQPTPVAVTSTGSVSSNVNENFNFALSASGTAPIQFSVTGLPPGLTLTGNTITGMPTASGVYSVVVTAANVGGTQTQNLTITIVNTGGPGNQPPHIVSGPSVSKNPATVNEAVTFSAVATDANNDQLTFTWDFGDGTTGVGEQIPHTYSVPGTNVVTLTVSDGAASDAHTILVAVNDAGIVASTSLTVLKAQLGFNFIKPGSANDKLAFTGLVPVVAGSKTAGVGATVWVGAKSYAITLDAHGKGGNPQFGLKFSYVKNGAFAGSVAPFIFTVKKQALFSALQEFGFVDANVNALPVTLPVALTIGGESFTATVPLMYTAKKGKTGTARSR